MDNRAFVRIAVIMAALAVVWTAALGRGCAPEVGERAVAPEPAPVAPPPAASPPRPVPPPKAAVTPAAPAAAAERGANAAKPSPLPQARTPRVDGHDYPAWYLSQQHGRATAAPREPAPPPPAATYKAPFH